MQLYKQQSSTPFPFPAPPPAPQFSTTFKTLSHPDPAHVEEFSKRWISADARAAKERFETESGVAQGSGVAAGFRVRPTRTLPGVPKVVEVFRQRIVERGGMLGIRAIGRMFRIMDDSGDRQLSRAELKFGLQDYGLTFTVDEMEALWRFLDRDSSGTVDYNEFLRGVRGDMNDRRVGMVQLAWEVLDKTGDNTVTIDDLRGTYDPSFHPEVGIASVCVCRWWLLVVACGCLRRRRDRCRGFWAGRGSGRGCCPLETVCERRVLLVPGLCCAGYQGHDDARPGPDRVFVAVGHNTEGRHRDV